MSTTSLHLTRCKMPPMTVSNCSQNTSDPACLQAIRSRQSEHQQEKLDSHKCRAGSMVVDDCWPNIGNGRKRCHILACSGGSDTEQLSYASIGS